MRTLVAQLDPADAVLTRDRERLAQIRAQRAAAAQAYFSAQRAGMGSHPPAACLRRGGGGGGARRARRQAISASLLDIGTGTGRMLELLGARP